VIRRRLRSARGCFARGQAFDFAGTAGVFAPCVDGWHPNTKNRVVMATHSVVPGTYIALAFINGGGLGLRWFRDEVARLGDDPHAYKRLVAASQLRLLARPIAIWYTTSWENSLTNARCSESAKKLA
jgi:sugar (pentulose or hexulose) kinase